MMGVSKGSRCMFGHLPVKSEPKAVTSFILKVYAASTAK